MAGSIVVMDQGILANLNALTDAWRGHRRVGLMQNDAEPEPWWTITQIEPAAFSGYGGPHNILLWSAATLSGHVAVSRAQPNVWAHNGGGVSGWVSGYYVIDNSGVLMWAALQPGPAVGLYVAGDTYTVIPEYTLRSRFPEI